jgi:hypothetical protein
VGDAARSATPWSGVPGRDTLITQFDAADGTLGLLAQISGLLNDGLM